MKKKTVMLPVEVPEGDYCQRWDLSKTYEAYKCQQMQGKLCTIFKCFPKRLFEGEKCLVHKLPACLEAGEEVQRG